ncbi:thiamine phosphate synthase [Fructilactobacillus florum]|nr:thiamine phosphate synthase [Fructilactobacillus florum]
MMKFKPEMLQVYLVIGTANVDYRVDRLLAVVAAAVRLGVTAVQFREKDQSRLTFAEQVQLGRAVHRLTAAQQVPLFVDDNFKLAQAVGAEGLHLGQTDPWPALKQKQQANLMVGLSVHDFTELNQSRSLLPYIDYLGVGPVFATKTKSDAKAPIGTSGLMDMVQQTDLPLVAIGGISERNVWKLKTIPIAGVAVISAITTSSKLATTIRTLKLQGGFHDQ